MRERRRRASQGQDRAGLLLFAFGLFAATEFVVTEAHATLSLVARDKESRSVGAIVVSCIREDAPSSFRLGQVAVLLPNGGAVLAQAHFFEAGRDEAARLLEQSRSAEEVLSEITSPDFDSGEGGGSQFRQYALIDEAGTALGFTGESTGEWAGHELGDSDGFVYSAQGNLLVGPEVLDVLVSGFQSESVDLEDKLLAALDAVSASGQGDSRCAGRTGDTAYFALLRQDAPLFSLEVSSETQDPAALLSQEIRSLREGEGDTATAFEKEDSKEGGCAFAPGSERRRSLRASGLLGLDRLWWGLFGGLLFARFLRRRWPRTPRYSSRGLLRLAVIGPVFGARHPRQK